MINLSNNDYQISKKDQKLLRQFEKQVLNSQKLDTALTTISLEKIGLI